LPVNRHYSPLGWDQNAWPGRCDDYADQAWHFRRDPREIEGARLDPPSCICTAGRARSNTNPNARSWRAIVIGCGAYWPRPCRASADWTLGSKWARLMGFSAALRRRLPKQCPPKARRTLRTLSAPPCDCPIGPRPLSKRQIVPLSTITCGTRRFTKTRLWISSSPLTGSVPQSARRTR
jgi:hypothetical protein